MIVLREHHPPEHVPLQWIVAFVDDEPVPELWHPGDNVTACLAWLDEWQLPAEVRSLAEDVEVRPNEVLRGGFYVDRYPSCAPRPVQPTSGVVMSIEFVANIELHTGRGWKMLPGNVQLRHVPDTGTWRMPNRQFSVPGTAGDLRFIEQSEFVTRYGVTAPAFRRDSRYFRVVLCLTSQE